MEVLLGFIDELILESDLKSLDYTTNKIGGKAVFPNEVVIEPKCELCSLPLALLVQIYAPIENNCYHRILYVFACVNARCWNDSESYRCFRVQVKNEAVAKESASDRKSNVTSGWCNGEDDWGESPSLSDKLDNMVLTDIEELDNSNAIANQTPIAYAEIEEGEENIVVENRTSRDENNIPAVFFETPEAPKVSEPEFVAYYMSVWNETETSSKSISDSHVNHLLEKYSREDPTFSKTEVDAKITDSYERGIPVHGDKMFHNFTKKIRSNAGQILRYHRGNRPLLLYPINGTMSKCRYCKGDLTFEFQVLPTIIPGLKLTSDLNKCVRLEFGTVLIYTCKNSCWDSDGPGYRLENVVVQKEMY